MNGEQLAKVADSMVEVFKHCTPMATLPDRSQIEPDSEIHSLTDGLRDQPRSILMFGPKGKAKLTDLVTLLHKMFKERLGSDTIKKVVVGHIRRTCEREGWTVPTKGNFGVEECVAKLEAKVRRAEAPGFLLATIDGIRVDEPVVDGLGWYVLQPSISAIVEFSRERFGHQYRVPDWVQRPHQNDDAMKKLLGAQGLVAVSIRSSEFNASTPDGVRKAEILLGASSLIFDHGGYWGCKLALSLCMTGKPCATLALSDGGGYQSGQGHDSRFACIGAPRHPISRAVIEKHVTQDWAVAARLALSKWAAGNASALESQIVTMWGWLGRAYMSVSTAEQLLFAVMALEVGIGLAKEDKIRKPLALAVAHLLADDVRERQDIRDRVLRWYDQRSALVHQGRDSATPVDSTLAFNTAVKVAQRMTMRSQEWVTPERLREFLDDRLVGG